MPLRKRRPLKSKTYIHVGLLLLAGGIINSFAIDRFLALGGGHVPPFTNLADAATNIQGAIDAAAAGGPRDGRGATPPFSRSATQTRRVAIP